MEVKPGDDFNVDLHEAITQIPSPTPELKGKIVDVIETGYTLNDKVIPVSYTHLDVYKRQGKKKRLNLRPSIVHFHYF